MIRAFEAPHCLMRTLLLDDLWRRTDLRVERAQPHSTSGSVLLVKAARTGACVAVLKRRRREEAEREELVAHLAELLRRAARRVAALTRISCRTNDISGARAHETAIEHLPACSITLPPRPDPPRSTQAVGCPCPVSHTLYILASVAVAILPGAKDELCHRALTQATSSLPGLRR